MRPRVLAALILITTPALAADPSPVPAVHGMVVTAQRFATEVGVHVLRGGGNAADAAVAVAYALAVTYPAAGNIGGGGFMTLRLADGRTTFLDFREKAPHAGTETMFLDAQGNVVPDRSTKTWFAVGVPGTVAGLEYAREHYGTKSRAELMAPAIRLAQDGFELTAGDLVTFADANADFRRDPASAMIFLRPDGSPLIPGDRLIQPDLAQTLQRISDLGAPGFYEGPVRDLIVRAGREGGGILAPEDFGSYKVRELAPVTCGYRGYTIVSSPPPSSGGVTLCEILQILRGYDLHAMGFHSAASVHAMAEAMRLAYRDRNNKLGDPDFVHNPVDQLTSPAYGDQLRTKIDPAHATPSTQLPADKPEGQQTTQFSIVDQHGNAVSLTYTLNSWFGARLVAAGTGIVMNNEMDDFTSKPGVPNQFGLVQGEVNAVAPGKTPLSSMSPTIVTKDGAVAMVIGSPGGSRIITITLEAISNMIDYGMTVQEAIDAPRIHMQWLPDTIYIEPFALSPDTRKTLEAEGYKFTDGAPWGIAEGIVAGAPRLTTPPGASSAGSLDLGTLKLPGATLFGAHDPRGPAGLAEGE